MTFRSASLSSPSPPYEPSLITRSPANPAKAEDPLIVSVLNVQDLLETAQYAAFWKSLDSVKDLVAGINGFHTAVRKCTTITLLLSAR